MGPQLEVLGVLRVLGVLKVLAVHENSKSFENLENFENPFSMPTSMYTVTRILSRDSDQAGQA